MNEEITRLTKMNQNINSNGEQNTYDIKSKRISILDTYGENFIKKEFITNPAIGREKELKELRNINGLHFQWHYTMLL